ncbi:acetyltransferase [Candidatus Vecturithrix granuli]|uniref:Acetyltransferase n=1 Tax=Vecturithrix granuli TaxID=1499967 RepID=A0A081BYR2_VECG1|nr:acetyltransferase [Candidatus Vecturithrix granuli]
MMERSIDIRQATLNDAEGIAMVKRLVWPGEDVNVAQISRAIAHEQHVTHAAVDGTTIVGFVDGFLIYNPSLHLRWEVDLLAIHPAYRGRQYGARLVEQTTQVGRQRGPHVVRGLIRVNNIASQRTFARCAYRQTPTSKHCMSPRLSVKRPPSMPLLRTGTQFRSRLLRTVDGGWKRHCRNRKTPCFHA